MAKRFDYNLLVIGGGAAGLVSSYIAAATKAKVALIEAHHMGGDCLNTGCVPSKALIHCAQIAYDATMSEQFGIQSHQTDIDFQQVMTYVQQKIADIEPHDSIERYSTLGVDCIKGYATLIDPHTVEVDNAKRFTARKIIIATGASPIIPSIRGLDTVPFVTSDTIWQMPSLPKKLLVLGGGAIGCELAQAFSRLGSEVTIVEQDEQLLPREDAISSELIEQQFHRENITILTDHKLESFKPDPTPIAQLSHVKTDASSTIEFDTVLLALGRKPNITGFGLEKLGVEVQSSGFIDASPFLRSSVPSIYVCGDVAGPYQFTHMAAHQAWYASVNALFSPFIRFKVNYDIVPRCTFTSPNIAHVGLTQKEADANNIPYQIYHYDVSDLDRAIVDNQAQGFVQVLTDKKKGKLLGVTIANQHAGDMIGESILAMKHGLGLNHILQTPHIYPTYNEANKYVAGKWKMDNTPSWALTFLERFHKWRR